MNLPLPFRSTFIALPMILIGLLALVALSTVLWARAVNPMATPPMLPQRTELPLAFFPNEG